MTTHVFIVDENTFSLHLKYLFAGTGAKSYVPTFINQANTKTSPLQEKLLTSMLADCARIRKNDLAVFYLQAKAGNEGRFYGIFKIDSPPFLDLGGSKQYLSNVGLKKILPFRVKLSPFKVYSQGISEWDALDNILGLTSPNQMIWSLIYRKLRGNRGNTMITLYESDRLVHLLSIKNSSQALSGNSFVFDPITRVIQKSSHHHKYSGATTQINILPRLINRINNHLAHEAHLQAYIMSDLENNQSLLKALGIDKRYIKWIGNEVACGVGMQKIDVLIQEDKPDLEKTLYVIELKDDYSEPDNITQIHKYVQWITQYYYPHQYCRVQPILISRKPHRPRSPIKATLLNNEIKQFNQSTPDYCFPIKLIEYSVVNNNIDFQ